MSQYWFPLFPGQVLNRFSRDTGFMDIYFPSPLTELVHVRRYKLLMLVSNLKRTPVCKTTKNRHI